MHLLRILYDKFINTRLFFKISLIAMLGILASTIVTLSISTIQTKKLFIDTFSITNKNIISNICNDFLEIHMEVFEITELLSHDIYLKEYLYGSSHSPKEQVQLIFNINKRLDTLSNLSNFKNFNILVIGMNQNIYSSDNWGLRWSIQDFYISDVYQNYQSHKQYLYYQYAPKGFVGTATNKPSIVVSKQLIHPLTNTYFGDLFINIEQDILLKTYSKYISPGNDIFIVDKNGIIVSSAQSSRIDQPFTELSMVLEESHLIDTSLDIFTYETPMYTLIFKEIPYTNLFLFSCIDHRGILKDFTKTQFIVYISVMMIVVFIVCMTFLITQTISQPLLTLTKEMQSITTGSLQVPLTISGSYEIQRLVFAYNFMLEKMDVSIKQLLKSEKERHIAELSALQMQINPHFLYNTLTAIKFLALKGDKTSVNTSINSLIVLLQNTVGSSSEMISVEEEMNLLKHYVSIMRLRYANAIEVYYYISPRSLGHTLPKLLLQPLVENAFFHGFSGRSSGYIKIFTSIQDENWLTIEIIDNGKGFDSDHILRNNTHLSHIGLSNIQKRLQLIYGQNASLSITSQIDQGTCVIIKILIA